MDRYDDEPGAWNAWLAPPADAPVSMYIDEIARVPRLSDAALASLRERAAGGDSDAIQRLVEAHLQLVVFIARDYAAPGEDLIELLQAGNVGLVRAAQRLGALSPDTPFRDAAEPEIRASMEQFAAS